MTKKSFVKLLIAIACALMLFSFILDRISGFNIYSNNNFDENISVVLEHPDGSSEYFDSVDFPLINKGAMIGANFISANIPEKSWGKSLTIKLEVTEDEAYSKLHDFMVIRSVDAYKYLILNQQAELMIFITILTSSMIIIFVLALFLIFERKWSSISRQGIFLLSFLALISSWFLAFNGMVNIFINNKVFCGDIEYISLFCTPIMLALFFFEQTKEDKVKKIQICLASGFTVFAGVCTILNYSTENYHYCRMISTFHILLLIGTILDFIIVIRYDMKNKLSSAVIKYGVLISLSIMFLEIVRYNIHRKTSSYISVLSRSFTSIAVVIFILALVVSYVVQLADHYISEYEKKILKI